MIACCNLAEKGYSIETINDFYDYHEGYTRQKIKVPMDATYEDFLEIKKNDYWSKKYSSMIALFGSYENLEKARQGSYDLKKLKMELKKMKAIFKIEKNN